MSVFAGFLCWYLIAVFVYSIAGTGISFLFAFVLMLLTAMGVFAKRLDGRRLICAVGALVGVIGFSFATEPSATILDNYVGRYIEIEGVISEVPDEHNEYYSYVLRTEKLRYNNEEAKLKNKLRITCENELSTGNRVAFRGFLKEIDSPENSTEFDYKRYFKSKGIGFSLHADELQLIDARAFLFSPIYAVEYVKCRISAAIDRFYTDDDAGMIKAVLLGQKSEFTDEFQKILVSTSALRFLYPSFLHIFFLLSVCELLFAAIPKRKRDIIIAVALLCFALFYGNYMSFVRSALILAGIIIYRRLRGFSHYTDIAAMVVSVCLVANPLLLYNSGFVMSVAIGIILNWFRLPLEERLGFIKNRKIRTMVSVWIIGTVGLTPLSAYFFNGASLYSIIFTFLYTPLSLLLFIISPVTLMFYEIFGSAGIFGIVVDVIIDLMQKLPQMVSLLPGYHLALAKTTVVGFAVFVIAVYLIKCAVDRDTGKAGFKAATIGLAVIIVGYTVDVFSDFGKMKLTFVNVGQSDGAILDIVGKDRILIDGGGGMADSEYNIGEKVFLPYLTAKGYSKIDLAIVSHCHRDHVEGIIAAIENLDVHTVMLSGCNEGGEYRERVVAAAEANETEILYVNAGDKLEFESGLLIEVLSPYKNDSFDEENDYSLALRMNYNDTTMFFGGDMSENIEKRLVGNIGEVDIIKVSHHGSKTSSSERFVAETSPDFAVFCVGRNNMYSHPDEEVVERYYKHGAKILRTDTMCDITLMCDKDRIGASWFGEVLKWQ
ncbi:MAG: DNA internalization-related competence protein ComEC/Rec2 [Eubacteriales bacterium]|nr:DNA internalization-related competence protein ComEC/Rec2 [Eubacteriales bacterium]